MERNGLLVEAVTDRTRGTVILLNNMLYRKIFVDDIADRIVVECMETGYSDSNVAQHCRTLHIFKTGHRTGFLRDSLVYNYASVTAEK